MRTMTPEERGIAAGYGGIWYNVENSILNRPIPKKTWKYERVFDYDIDDKVLKDGIFFVPSEEAKKKYFIYEDNLYKLVNPDGELNPIFKGIDPLA